MPDAEFQSRRLSRFSDADRRAQMQEMTRLQTENGELKQLVVRLSETIIRNVTATR